MKKSFVYLFICILMLITFNISNKLYAKKIWIVIRKDDKISTDICDILKKELKTSYYDKYIIFNYPDTFAEDHDPVLFLDQILTYNGDCVHTTFCEAKLIYSTMELPNIDSTTTSLPMVAVAAHYLYWSMETNIDNNNKYKTAIDIKNRIFKHLNEYFE